MLLRIVRGLGELMLTAGVLVLLFLGWVLGFQARADQAEQASAVQSIERRFATGPNGGGPLPVVAAPSGRDASKPASSPADPPPSPGEAFAVLRIPRLAPGWAKPVGEGIGNDVLAKGMGHYPKTALPGKVGNVAIAGHRSGHGNPLLDIDRMKSGDVLVLETASSYAVYRTVRSIIVAPNRTDVVAPVPERPGVQPTEAWLTLTTCNPRWGNSERYIVFSKLERTIPRSQGLPAAYLAAPQG